MPGYGVPRSRGGLLRWRWAADRLRKSHNYWLVTTRPDGAPHAMPVWGVWVDDRFYFSSGRESRKSRNLAANARCIVSNEAAEAAVIVEGVAAELTDRAAIDRVAGPYHRKYRPWKLDADRQAIYEVRPRVAFGVVERTFPRTTTRWTFAP